MEDLTSVICPYCEYGDELINQIEHKNIGKKYSGACASCNKEFIVEFVFVPVCRTSKLED